MTLTVKLYVKGDSDFTHLSAKTTLFPSPNWRCQKPSYSLCDRKI